MFVTACVSLVACGAPAGFQGAADVARELDQARSEVPLPPGMTYPPYPSLDPNGAYQSGYARAVIEFQAQCAWFDYWAKAIANNDRAAMERASKMWDEMRTWGTFKEMPADSQRYLEGIVERARLGDPGGLIRDVELNCS